MANEYSAEDLLDFLSHAGDRGLMPAATSQALAVATRNVFSVLGENEQTDLRTLDLNALIKRFNNKRAKDFTQASLKEYGRRLHRAIELYLGWKQDPANFTVKTRATAPRSRERKESTAESAETDFRLSGPPTLNATGYQSAFPVRPGVVVHLTNIPNDLTEAEANRLAQFVKMLALQPT